MARSLRRWFVCQGVAASFVIGATLPTAIAGSDAASQVQSARLKATLRWLNDAEGHHSRVTGTPGGQLTTHRVVRELEKLGLPVDILATPIRHAFSGHWTWAYSVRARIGAGPALVLVAHIDSKAADDRSHATKSNWNWQTDRAPGADDNASGVAALLELARVFARTPPTRYRLDLVFTAAEEMAEIARDGFMTNIGAETVAASYIDELSIGCIAVDMLLKARPYGFLFRVYSDGRFGSSMLVDALQHASWLTSTPILVEARVEPSFTWSDHGAFWAMDMPGVLLIEDDFHHPNYHRQGDAFANYTEHDWQQLTVATRWLAHVVDLVAR